MIAQEHDGNKGLFDRIVSVEEDQLILVTERLAKKCEEFYWIYAPWPLGSEFMFTSFLLTIHFLMDASMLNLFASQDKTFLLLNFKFWFHLPSSL